ncbi:MAG: hypothetical protein A3H32_10215 [Betaproteobacteria bacterium RIFCSPLOWO2_02_FULL_63_19]|nr:MAG: hypothetical protein A3H32_10215 [Betaproteobacteria bacterium RIFCSPLOWO2_02_FULL_63_19]
MNVCAASQGVEGGHLFGAELDEEHEARGAKDRGMFKHFEVGGQLHIAQPCHHAGQKQHRIKPDSAPQARPAARATDWIVSISGELNRCRMLPESRAGRPGWVRKNMTNR